MMAARDLMVRPDHAGNAAWADVTAKETSSCVDMATLAMMEEVIGEATGRYFAVEGGTVLPLMKLLITFVIAGGLSIEGCVCNAWKFVLR